MLNKYIENKRISLTFFFTIWLMYTLVYMTKNCYSAAMATIVDAGVLTKTQTGTISAAFWLVYAAFQIVGGAAADKFKPEKLIAIGLLGGGVANLIIYFNHNYHVMLITWSLNAIVQFGIWPSIFKIISTQLAHTQRTKAIFYIGTSNSAALMLSYIFAAIFKNWEDNFLVSAIVLIVMALLWLSVYKMFSKHMVEEHLAHDFSSVVKEKVHPGKLLISSGLVVVLVIGCLRDTLNSAIRSLTPVMVMETYNITPFAANALNMILVVVGALNVFVARLVHPKPFKNEMLALLSLMIPLIPLLFAVMFIGDYHVLIAMCLLSLAVALLSAGSMFTGSYLVRHFNKYGCGGTIAGIVNAAAAFGSVLANYVFSRTADVYGWSYTTKLWVIISFVVILLIVVIYPVWKRFIKKDAI